MQQPAAQGSQQDSSTDAGSASTSSAASGAAASQKADAGDISCFGTGMDVTCTASYDDGQAAMDVPASGSGTADPVAASSSLEQAASSLEQTVRAQPAIEDTPPMLSGIAQVLSVVLLLSPFFFWGTSMVGMKMLAPHTSPLFVSAWRLGPAGVLLVLWGASRGRPHPATGMAWLAIAAFGLVDATCFQGFLAEGLQRTSAGLGSVIIDSQPLTVAVLASVFFGESLSAIGYAGLLVGVAGLLLLEVPQETLEVFINNLRSNQPTGVSLPSGSIWDSGEWWMLLAAQSMAVGTVMVRWVTKYCDPVMATGWHMILGSLPLVAVSAVQEGPELAARLSQLTGSDAAILLYISLLGSAASYGVFFYNASRGNLTALSSLTFLTPMFAALAGYLILGEVLTPVQLAGAGITLGAVGLLNSKSNQKAKET